MNSYFIEQNKCQLCQKQIHNYEFKIEYGEYFYHKECYKCKCCSRLFPVLDSYNNTNLVPIQDQNGYLYCQKDFITTLKCSLCQLTFDRESLIYKLNDIESNQHLVHFNCVSCHLCKSKIDISNEYILEKGLSAQQQFNLYCKCCTVKKSKILMKKKHDDDDDDGVQKKNKKMISVHHRLSSRQKELLIAKLININHQVQSEEADRLIENLSSEICCSKKSLIYYVEKHLRKECIENNKNKTEANLSGKSNPITLMIEELNKLDKILAPNQFPFGQFSRKLINNSENKNIIS